MLVVGGLIVGNPDDTRESIDANLDVRAAATSTGRTSSIRRRIRGTPMTRDFRERGLIVNAHVEEYDGTTAVTRSAHLDGRRDRVHALAGRALDEGAAHAGGAAADPVFVLSHARAMLAHTFRGTTWRSSSVSRARAPPSGATSRSVHESASIWSGPILLRPIRMSVIHWAFRRNPCTMDQPRSL